MIKLVGHFLDKNYEEKQKLQKVCEIDAVVLTPKIQTMEIPTAKIYSESLCGETVRTTHTLILSTLINPKLHG